MKYSAQRCIPELERKVRLHLRKGRISYRIDETYIKIKEKEYGIICIERLISTEIQLTIMLSPKRMAGVRAVFQFFRKMLGSCHSSRPKIISEDKNSVYPPVFKTLKYFHLCDKLSKFRQKYLNEVIEQDHKFIKKLVNGLFLKISSFSLKSFTRV